MEMKKGHGAGFTHAVGQKIDNPENTVILIELDLLRTCLIKFVGKIGADKLISELLEKEENDLFEDIRFEYGKITQSWPFNFRKDTSREIVDNIIRKLHSWELTDTRQIGELKDFEIKELTDFLK